MTWFRVGGAGVPVSLKNKMNAVLNKKFGTSGQNYPPNGWPDDVNLLGPLPEKTVAGAIAHTDDAADTVPVKSMICSIVPKQAGSGTPSPTNVRALSGYTGLTLSQAGTNFFNEDWEVGGINDTTGQPNSDTNKIRSKTFFRIVGGLQYYAAAPAAIRVLFYASDESFISETVNIRNSAFTAPENAYYAKIIGTVDYGITYNFDISINYPATDTIYHAYTTPNNTEDSWSSIGAIYGGERDLTLGALKSKGFINVFDTVDGNVVESQYYNFNKINGNVAVLGNTVRITFNAKTATNVNRISSSYSFVGCNVAPHQFSYAADAEHFYINTVFYLFIDKTVCGETAPSVFDWLVSLINNGTPLQVYMEYSTATEYNNLSTYDFETLYAVNNFFSDIVGGQTQVTYRQDIDLALQAVSSSRGLMMASRPVTQLVGEESDPDQVNELVEDDENDIREQLNEVVENDETEQEGENDAR